MDETVPTPCRPSLRLVYHVARTRRDSREVSTALRTRAPFCAFLCVLWGGRGSCLGSFTTFTVMTGRARGGCARRCAADDAPR